MAVYVLYVLCSKRSLAQGAVQRREQAGGIVISVLGIGEAGRVKGVMICVRVGGGSGCAGRCARTPAIGEGFELIGE